MAKGKIKVGGLSIKDIMNIPMGELSTYSLTDIKNLTSRLVSAGNKRARRFIAKYGANSIKLKSYTSKGKFSVKGIKTTKEALEEFERVSEFLSRKTSSIKGMKQFQKQIESPAKYYSEKYQDKKPYKSFDDEEFEVSEGNVWQTLDDMIDSNRDLFEKQTVYELHDVVKDYMEEKEVESSKDLNNEDKKRLRDIVDDYIQNNGNIDLTSFVGNANGKRKSTGFKFSK